MDEIDLAFETPEEKRRRLTGEMMREVRWFISSVVIFICTFAIAVGYPFSFAEDYRGFLAAGLVVVIATTFFLFIFSGLRWMYLDRQITQLNRETV